MLSYMDGENELSEEEAFSLVRDHFGNPVEIKALFQNVHSGEVFVSFARKLGAIFVLSILVSILFSPLYIFQDIFIRNFGVYYPDKFFVVSYVFLKFITPVIPAIFIWTILIIWRRKIIRNEKVWFMKADIVTYIGILVFFAFFLPLISTYLISGFIHNIQGYLFLTSLT